eukprot:NODE_332_length_9388_cov_1.370008.p3 type:complete len:572 gc:universal NODE_332_length_9388_cov_1.370008:1267-2982(+)
MAQLNKKFKAENSFECNVGIFKSLNANVTLKANIKSEVFDFIVKEVDLTKNVVQFNPLAELPNLPQTEEAENWKNTVITTNSVFQKYYTADELEDLSQKIETILSNKNGQLELKPIKDKLDRTSIHKLFKSVTNIHSKADNGLIKIKYGNERAKGRSINWKELGGDFLQFSLAKSNIDTIQAISEISRKSKLTTKNFSYAGTKDKKGCTVQNVRVYKTLHTKLLNLKFQFDNEFKKIALSNFEYRSKQLRLGDIYGNNFTVVLREITLKSTRDISDDRISILNDSFEHLKQFGFINYFGLQRFGHSSVGTEEFGKLVLLKDWKGLIDLLLKPRSNETEKVMVARHNFSLNQDFEEALKLFPRACLAERSILMHLKDNRNDFYGAFMKIPRNLRTLYAHAFQSYIFNHMVSKRLELYGNKLVEGDLVIDCTNETDRHDNGVKSIIPLIITSENIGKFSIYDCVLPCPGSETMYPSNMERYYEDFLESQNLNTEIWEDDSQLNLSGTYRHIVARAEDLKWKIFKYNDIQPTERIFQHDAVDFDIADGKNLGVKVQVTLKTSSYVTMMLREIIC